MNQSTRPAIALALVLFAGYAHAKMAASGADVQFLATGPAGMQIVGTTKDLQLHEEADTLRVVVPLSNLDTGIALRNKHMRDKYLEVDKYPNAELTVSRAALKTDGGGSANGTMKLHGRTHDVKFDYTVKRQGGAASVEGKVRLELGDYGIQVPSYLGVTVRPEVNVTVKFAAAGL